MRIKIGGWKHSYRVLPRSLEFSQKVEFITMQLIVATTVTEGKLEMFGFRLSPNSSFSCLWVKCTDSFFCFFLSLHPNLRSELWETGMQTLYMHFTNANDLILLTVPLFYRCVLVSPMPFFIKRFEFSAILFFRMTELLNRIRCSVVGNLQSENSMYNIDYISILFIFEMLKSDTPANVTKKD